MSIMHLLLLPTTLYVHGWYERECYEIGLRGLKVCVAAIMMITQLAGVHGLARSVEQSRWIGKGIFKCRLGRCVGFASFVPLNEWMTGLPWGLACVPLWAPLHTGDGWNSRVVVYTQHYTQTVTTGLSTSQDARALHVLGILFRVFRGTGLWRTTRIYGLVFRFSGHSVPLTSCSTNEIKLRFLDKITR